MISVKVAAAKAVEFMKGFFPESEVIRLEEVEITEDKKFWYITLSILEEESTGQPMFAGLSVRKSKNYKIFKIDTETGEVLSMKIRDVA